MVAAPVGAVSDICNSGNRIERTAMKFSCRDVADSRSLSFLICVRIKTFLPHRVEIYEMVRMTEIFLSNLHFSHHCSVFQLSEERAERFARLEVDRSVLDLDDHIVIELSVERYEFKTCLHCPVRSLRIIYECTPHDDSAERLDSLGQHVRSVCMGTSVILWAGLTFRVCLYEEASEVRYD